MSTLSPGAQWLTSRAATLVSVARNGLASTSSTTLLLPLDSAFASASAVFASIANNSSRPEVGWADAAPSSTWKKRCAATVSVRAWAAPASNPSDSNTATA